MSPFEIVMLICFGASWPLSVYKTWTTKTSRGKSLAFLALILIGYISGTVHKLVYNPDPVVYLYIFNAILVSLDLVLSYRYRNQTGIPPAHPAQAS
ncbi:hypothetical protein HQ520_03930 [bacterium]|nr:hypothetical protein [bacterium]